MSNLVLSEFTLESSQPLSSWFKTAKDLYIFGGPQFAFPIDQQQIAAYLDEKEKCPCTVLDSASRETIGHCKFNYSEPIPTISRIFIAPKHRGKGYGKELVQLMSRRLFEEKAVKILQLYVFEFNTTARRCYEKVGFVVDLDETTYLVVQEENWTRLKMKLSRKTFEDLMIKN